MALDWQSMDYGSLGETASYTSRGWGFVPSLDRGSDDGLGLLALECDRPNGFREESKYNLFELDALPGLMGRRFKLVRSVPAEPPFYVVTLGGLPSCTCTAGQCRAKEGLRACKHLEALHVILNKGLLGGVVLDNEQSGLAFEDRPGERTVAELEAAR